MSVLVDLTECIGCRQCEHACRVSNGIPAGTLESYEDKSVFERKRRPAPDSFTVVNAYQPTTTESDPVYVKTNCLHCLHPSCVSACIVGALRKKPQGPVTYAAWRCIGCRYCMVACPFQIPAYNYDDAFTPEVLKCTFCHDRSGKEGKVLPACVETCPREVMVYGKRGEMLALARERIEKHPEKYISHIYGEREVGGTSWLYLSGLPFDGLGFLDLPEDAPPVLTETIQHSVFKYFLPPLGLYAGLGVAMYLTGSRHRTAAVAAHSAPTPEPDPPASAPSDLGGHHEIPMPVDRKLLTPGVFILLGLMLVGLACGAYRFIFGIGASTNLDQQWPWGLWIAVDVASGVALAAGGFTTAFLTHIIHRERFHAIARPALLTAMLGYTFVAIGLQADLGRYYNVWHPVIMWQPNSVLFEVGMCVMCYLTVLYLEFAPIVCERVMQMGDRWPRLSRLAAWAHGKLDRVMFLLVIAGVVLSCLHQSSLGTLLVITPQKLHPLWWSPWSPLFFLLSAIAVGFPMAIWESLFAGWSLKLKPEMDVLVPLSRLVPITLGVYLAVKIWDLVNRGAWVHLGEGSVQSYAWLVEIGGGIVVPMVMLLLPAVRRSPRLLFTAASLVVLLGVLFNRVNVFLIGYRPPFAETLYVPSFAEFAVTIGLISCLMLIYRVAVTYLPVISQPHPEGTA